MSRFEKMTLDKTIKRFNDNAEYERTHGSLQGCLDFRQLVEWLKDYQSLLSTQKVGRWKRVSIDKYVQHAMAYYRCSECGRDHIGMTNFCSNCGAKMESEE